MLSSFICVIAAVACASAAEWTKNTNHFISYWNNCVISVYILEVPCNRFSCW